MNTAVNSINEGATARAFDKQSTSFDESFSSNPIVQYKRQRVREHALSYLQPGSRILELNAGTGEDAIFFAGQGHSVHSTDISVGMQQALAQKVKQFKLEHRISYELCSFNTLENLQNKGPYDMIFSNFAGLNCTNNLDKVLHFFSPLLKPGGLVTLVVMPKFCLWETMLAFKGRFTTAFRRFSGKAKAHIEGEYFHCWYYNPSYIIREMKNSFDLLGLEGLCTLVPPSYFENFTEKHPVLYDWLKKKEDRWKSRWPWKYIGDYFIISLRKKPV